MRNFIYIILYALLSPLTGNAQTKAPNGSISVTYRQVENGKVSQGYHEIALTCWSGECELQSVTFNQCWGLKDKDDYSFIKVETTSTRAGNLKISRATNDTMVLEEQNAGTTLTYRFTYQLTNEGELGMDSLKDFSGGASKNSDILGQVVTWQLVPIRSKDSIHFETVRLDCPIRVHALAAK